MSDSLQPHGLYSPWNSPGQNTGVGSLSLLQGNLPNPGIEPRSPTLQAYSLSDEPQGKPKNTGVGSLFLLQRIFPIQESNQGLLHCRQILYQLSYEGQLLMVIFKVILPLGFPDGARGKKSSCNAGDPSLIPGSGRSPREGIGYPLQYSWASLVAQLIKNPPAMWETWV